MDNYSELLKSLQEMTNNVQQMSEVQEPEVNTRDLIQIRRGNQENLPDLAQGELAYCFDTEKLWVGAIEGNVLINKDDFNGMLINAKEFGMIGDGVTDNTLKYRELIEYSKTEQRGVYFPKGEYYFTEAMYLPAGYTQVCDTEAYFTNDNSSCMYINGTHYGMYVDKQYGGFGNITFIGGTYDMKVQRNGVSLDNGFFRLYRAENFVFKNLTIKNISDGHCFDLNGCRNVLIDNCNFLGFYSIDGARNFSEAVQIGNHVGLSVLPADFAPSYNVKIQNCNCDSSGDKGLYNDKEIVYGCWGCMAGNHGIVRAEGNHDISILNNKCVGCLTAGVRVFAFKNTLVDGNTFINTGYGVDVSTNTSGADGENYNRASETCVITNNTFIQSSLTAEGIPAGVVIDKVNMVNLVVGNNVFSTGNYTRPPFYGTGTMSRFIRLMECEQFSINNNVTDNNLAITSIDNILFLRECIEGVISGNSFSGLTGSGSDTDSAIETDCKDSEHGGTCGRISIKDNYIRGSNGMYLGNIVDSSITGNDIAFTTFCGIRFASENNTRQIQVEDIYVQGNTISYVGNEDTAYSYRVDSSNYMRDIIFSNNITGRNELNYVEPDGTYYDRIVDGVILYRESSGVNVKYLLSVSDYDGTIVTKRLSF